MLTVRMRAMELASDPANFERPVERFEEPGRAKLEADAYLAISIDEIVHRLASSDGHRARFLAHFSKLVTDDFGLVRNSQLPVEPVIDRFGATLLEVYDDPETVNRVLEDTPKGRRTSEAALLYVEACGVPTDPGDSEDTGRSASPAQEPEIGSPESYRDASGPIRAGLGGTYHNEVREVLQALFIRHTLTTDERAAHLRPASKGMLKIAGLALAQSQAPARGIPVIEDGVLDTAPNIARLRGLPAHRDSRRAKTRPHHKCLALPILPANEVLHGGSAIQRLWERTCDLVLATHLYALGDDREDLRITGYGPYENYQYRQEHAAQT